MLDKRSIELRLNIIAMLEAAGRGHLGSALSLVEILRVLYDDILRYDCADPRIKNRDRLILSKGHGCLALYAILFDKGFISADDMTQFCSLDGILGGHPEAAKVPGVEFSTGSLGHGFPVAVGMALNAKYENLGYKVVVVIGDGESNEGSNWEAALIAAKHKLDNLTVVVDYNHVQSYGTTAEVMELEPYRQKWEAFNFKAIEIDGHSLADLKQAFTSLPLSPLKPSCIICHTVKGKGIPEAENNPEWHHLNSISHEKAEGLRQTLEQYNA